MKRLLLALICVSALLGLLSAGASAAQTASPAGVTVSLAAHPDSLPTGETTTFSGVVTDGEQALAGEEVVLAAFDNEECTGEPIAFWSGEDHDDLVTDESGSFSFDIYSDEPGTWYFTAAVLYGDPVQPYESACVAVTWTAVAPPPVEENSEPSSYLCWNREMTNPVAYLDSVADAMWKTGNYYEPQAILGNVVGGTNLGAYHLVCNAPSTMKITPEVIGGSGEVYSPEATVAYHHDHPLGGNDLNVYHLYE